MTKRKDNNIEYKNIHLRGRRNSYTGNKKEKGTTVTSSGKTAKECAAILNYKCREAGVTIPNPDVGFQKPMTKGEKSTGDKNVYFDESRSFYMGRKWRSGGKRITAWGKTAKQCAMILNYRCKQAGLSFPNPGVGFQKRMTRNAEKSTGYKNVTFHKSWNGFLGRKHQTGKIITAAAKTAKECAMKLNYRCGEAGFTIPNLDVGFQKPKPRKRVSRKKKQKKKKIKRKARKRTTIKIESGVTMTPIAFPNAMVGKEYAKLQCKPFDQKEFQRLQKNFNGRASRKRMAVRTRRTKNDEINPRYVERVRYFLDRKENAEALVLMRWGNLVDKSILQKGNAKAFGVKPWQLTQSKPTTGSRKKASENEVESVSELVDLSKVFDAKYDEIVDLTLDDSSMEIEIKVKIEQP